MLKVKRRNKTTVGTLSIALFWLVCISGIVLIFPYEVKNPYLNISQIILGNPWASFIRNFHFWSSQLFLILSLIHLYDHFHRRKKIGIKPLMALRLSLGVLIIFLVMLSGFLLKGDADSIQARQILKSLSTLIPFFGESLAFSLLGPDESFLIIYIHHIATFTIFIAYIIVEHSRKYFSPLRDFILATLLISVVSYFFTAPLHDNLSPTVKGPWYFVGFQEILHWLSQPGLSVFIILILLLLLYFVNTGKKKTVYFTKRTLLGFTVFYLILTLVGLFFRGEQWQWKLPWEADYAHTVLHNFKTSRVHFSSDFDQEKISGSPTIEGRKESCLVCHTKTFGFSPAHNPEVIGCFSCHGGNPNSSVKKQAHRNMIHIPGNLSNAKQSCGTSNCHPQIVERVPTGLMSTLSGMISVNRTVFGEQTDPDILTHVNELGNSPADEHLKNLCVRCHLGNPKTEYGPAKEWTRGGGCLACHLNYSPAAEKALKISKSKYIRAHPSVDLNVSNKHCFGCHNRSGRIATNYEGWHETTKTPAQMPDSINFRLIEGRRVFEKKQEDIHHQAGLECIDCHHSYELMGDGNSYAHEEDQQDVQCTDCHTNRDAFITTAEDLDSESAVIAALRYGNIENQRFLTTEKYGHPLINTFVKNDSAFLVSKNSKTRFFISPPAEVCDRTNAHSNLSCSSCHSSWSSSCIGCHNSYDKNTAGFDMLENTKKMGTWVEKKGSSTAKLPALGIRKTADKNEIVPVIPGMVLTIDKKSFTNNNQDTVLFHRLFAPVAPHTTQTKGRSCKSCHNNPVSLGYGEGELNYQIKNEIGKWVFNPRYGPERNDSLPKDAWIGFLEKGKGMVSTRKNVFPFTIDQQKKMLYVGACLTCHKEDSKEMTGSLTNFKQMELNRSKNCVVPQWNE